jgi:hypothetical protein
MNAQQLANELQSGARFVQYQYCVSILVMTFKRGTDIYFIRADESKTVKGLAWTLLTFVAEWWGIPWGPIYTVQSLWVNLRGGHDLTPQAATTLRLPIDKSTLYPEQGRAAGGVSNSVTHLSLHCCLPMCATTDGRLLPRSLYTVPAFPQLEVAR